MAERLAEQREFVCKAFAYSGLSAKTGSLSGYSINGLDWHAQMKCMLPLRSTQVYLHYDSYLVEGRARCKNLSFTLDGIIHHESDYRHPEKFRSKDRPQNFYGMQIHLKYTQRPVLQCM